MRSFNNKIGKQLTRVVECVLIFGVALLVVLYALGYYDLSFLDRYKITSKDPDAPGRDGADETESGNSVEIAPEETSGGGNTADDSNLISYETRNVSKVFDTAMLRDKPSNHRTLPQAQRIGYSTADGSAIYDGERMLLAKMTFDFKLPERYAYSQRTREKTIVVTPDDDTENYTVTRKTNEFRPALEVYTGYLLMDNGEDTYLISQDGVPLSRFAYDKYVPAYQRNADGEPLFKKRDENGRTVYFSLSEDGKSFVYCDFDEAKDGRGLLFDYPASWGVSDSTSVFRDTKKQTKLMSAEELDELKKQIEEEVAAKNREAERKIDEILAGDGDELERVRAAAAVEYYSVDTELARAVEDYEKNTDKVEYVGFVVKNSYGDIVGQLTEYKFTRAYGFTLNRAAVVEDSDRGALYFINENGYKAFANVSTYVNEHDRYVTSYLMPPLTDGIENIGMFYFDNGLVRVRRQTIDTFQHDYYHLTRVVEDTTYLYRPDGTVYEHPAGYTLEGYSEGIMLLKRESSGKYGMMSVEGEWIAQPVYDTATPFIGGLATLGIAEDDGMRWGMIDSSGNIVMAFAYDSLSSNSSGTVVAYRRENGWSVYRICEKINTNE